LAFRPRPEHELDRLPDEELLAYLRDARAAGDTDAARTALQVLVFGHWSIVVARLRMKLPAHVVEDTAGDVIARAITSSFSGESVGEFKAWLNTILRRAIADFYRERSRTIATDPLEADDEHPGPEPATSDAAGYVETQMVIQAALDELRQDHRRVVEIVVFEARSAADACAEIEDMTPDNAYQIVRRFRVRLRELLEDDNG